VYFFWTGSTTIGATEAVVRPSIPILGHICDAGTTVLDSNLIGPFPPLQGAVFNAGLVDPAAIL
jgi:hypothetical protein